MERFDFFPVQCTICSSEVILPINADSLCILCEGCGHGHFIYPRMLGPVIVDGIRVDSRTVGQLRFQGSSYPIEIIPFATTPDNVLRQVVTIKTGAPTRVFSVNRSYNNNLSFDCRARWHWHLEAPEKFNPAGFLQTEIIPCMGCASRRGQPLQGNLTTDPLTTLVHNLGPICLACSSCESLYFINPLMHGAVHIGKTHFTFGTWSHNAEATQPSVWDTPLEDVKELIKIKTGSPVRLFSHYTTPAGTAHLNCRAPWQWYLVC